MPTLNLFAACERVLIDPISDKISLIGVLDRIMPEAVLAKNEQGQSGGEDGKFLMPRLSLATIWGLAPDDTDAKYEQKVSIVAGHDGKVTEGTDAMAFTMTDNIHRLVQPIRISCRRAGRFTFELFIKRQEDTEWGEPVARYPFILLEPQLAEPFFKGNALEANSVA
jgi:hypothetical protein